MSKGNNVPWSRNLDVSTVFGLVDLLCGLCLPILACQSQKSSSINSNQSFYLQRRAVII